MINDINLNADPFTEKANLTMPANGDDLKTLAHLAHFGSNVSLFPRGASGWAAFSNASEASASSWLLQPGEAKQPPICISSDLIRWAWQHTYGGRCADGEVYIVDDPPQESQTIYVRVSQSWRSACSDAIHKPSKPFPADVDASHKLYLSGKQLYQLLFPLGVVELSGQSNRLKVRSQSLRGKPSRSGAPKRFNCRVSALIVRRIIESITVFSFYNDDTIALAVGDNCLMLSQDAFEVVIPFLVPNDDEADEIARPFLPLQLPEVIVQSQLATIEQFDRDYYTGMNKLLASHFNLIWDAINDIKPQSDRDREQLQEVCDALLEVKPIVERINQKKYVETLLPLREALHFAAEVHESFQRSHWMYAF